MSILIKGMEMPERCEDCFCYRRNAKYDYAYCNISYVNVLGHGNARLNSCPLVPVPPHGRLIDADALRKDIKESIDECHKWANEIEGGEMYARASQALGTFVECALRVKAAPTIIPAEECE